MRSRSVSLTGVTGFVGWHVAETLRSGGWIVRGIARPGNSKPGPEGIDVVCAPLERGPLTTAFDGSDVVIHCAGVTRAQDEAAFSAVNVAGTRAVVEAGNAVGARLVLISSLAAGGAGTPAHPRRESDAPQPVNAYGRSKLAAERVVREHGSTPWTILRPGAVYGPRDRGFLPLFRLSNNGLFLLATPASAAFTLMHVSDLARAIAAAASTEGADRETLFLGHPQPHTAADILRAMAHALGRTWRPRRIPRLALKAAARAGDVAWKLGFQPVMDTSRLAEFNAEGFVCAVDRARDVLGFSASVSLHDGFERTARWYQEQRWL